MVTQHYFDQYPRYQEFPAWKYGDYMELVRKAKLYDELTGQKDCPEPKKQEWHESLISRMHGTTWQVTIK